MHAVICNKECNSENETNKHLYYMHLFCSVFHLRHYPLKFGLRFLRVLPKMMMSCKKIPESLPDEFSAKDAFNSLPLDDMWEDADMESVMVYLKGNRDLRIPPSWRPHLNVNSDQFQG